MDSEWATGGKLISMLPLRSRITLLSIRQLYITDGNIIEVKPGQGVNSLTIAVE